MIRVYLDWNIISNLKNANFISEREFLIKNADKISIPFSPAHFEDISKSDTPENAKLLDDISNMCIFCSKNHLAYDKERDIAAPYIATPKQYYEEYKQNHKTLANSFNPSYFIKTLDELCQSGTIPSLDMPINLPELDINESKHFKELDDVKTLKDLIFWGLNFTYNIINDKDTYITLRDTLKNYVITQTLEPTNVIPSIDLILKKIGIEKCFMDIITDFHKQQKTKNSLSYFVMAYLLLDAFYKPDRLPKNSNNAINIITDAMHAYYGAFCDYIVTDDKKFAEKTRVLFNAFDIDVPIISSKELTNTLSPVLWKSQNDAKTDISELLVTTGLFEKNHGYKINENEDNFNWVVALDNYYLNFFNHACVYEGKDEMAGKIYVQLLRRFKSLSRYVFYSEVEKLLDLLSKTFGPIPELERRAIVNCQENAMFTWKTDDECLTITIREDITNKGRPELDILIDTSTIRITNK